MNKPETQAPAIVADRLVKRFGDVTAVDGVTFDVPPGTITGLLGGNGAGKTTTLSMLLGLITPTDGSARVFGIDMARERMRALPRMNFSSPYVDMPGRLSVYENLAVYAGLYGVQGARRRIEELSEELELSALLKRRTNTLSAGQRSRVVLAKALINRPEALLLDEPTASLDPDTADWIRTYLEDYARQSGASILLASHNMPEVERLCADVIMLRRGTVVDTGTPADIIARYGRENLEEVFLDIARASEPGEAA